MISFDTKGYEIEGKFGKWDTVDEIIIDGDTFYLLENQKYGHDAAGVILNAYGQIISDEVFHGFDEATKQQIRDSIKNQELVKADTDDKKSEKETEKGEGYQALAVQEGDATSHSLQDPKQIQALQETQRAERLLIWQKYLQNGTWERRSESGTEANYDMIDGRVNNQPKDKQASIRQPGNKKKKKRVSVIRRLHQKQIDIAKRSGKPVPMYLQEAERNRK